MERHVLLWGIRLECALWKRYRNLVAGERHCECAGLLGFASAGPWPQREKRVKLLAEAFPERSKSPDRRMCFTQKPRQTCGGMEGVVGAFGELQFQMAGQKSQGEMQCANSIQRGSCWKLEWLKSITTYSLLTFLSVKSWEEVVVEGEVALQQCRWLLANSLGME